MGLNIKQIYGKSDVKHNTSKYIFSKFWMRITTTIPKVALQKYNLNNDFKFRSSKIK